MMFMRYVFARYLRAVLSLETQFLPQKNHLECDFRQISSKFIETIENSSEALCFTTFHQPWQALKELKDPLHLVRAQI